MIFDMHPNIWFAPIYQVHCKIIMLYSMTSQKITANSPTFTLEFWRNHKWCLCFFRGLAVTSTAKVIFHLFHWKPNSQMLSHERQCELISSQSLPLEHNAVLNTQNDWKCTIGMNGFLHITMVCIIHCKNQHNSSWIYGTGSIGDIMFAQIFRHNRPPTDTQQLI